MRGGPTFDSERVQFNLAKMKTHGEMFEVVIEPDAAIAYKEGQKTDIKEIVKAQKVFADAKKGLLASEEHMQSAFGTTDALTIAKKLLDEGEIQLTAEYRTTIREEKRNRLIEHIRRNAIDPKTNLPHPTKRIELAFTEAKIHIEETKSIDAQVKDIVRRLQPILPIRFDVAVFRIHLSPEHSQKFYGDVKNFGTIKREEWMDDGSWVCFLEIPAGLQNDLMDMLNTKTQGTALMEKAQE